MRAAAEFLREFAYRYNAHDVAVFFAEQRHSTELLCFFDRHFAALNLDVFEDLLVDEVLNREQLFVRQGGEAEPVAHIALLP